MSEYILRPADAFLAPMLTVKLHGSLVAGLERECGIRFQDTLDLDEASILDEWANHVCENPIGQKANLARALAALIRCGSGLEVGEEGHNNPIGFWEMAR